MRIRLMVLLFSLSSPLTVLAANRPASDYTISVHVMASSAEGAESRCGKRLVAAIDGQIVMLSVCNDPLPSRLGDYKARLVKDQMTAGDDLDRRYALLLPNGGEYTVYLAGVCEKQATVCFGYSVQAP